MPIPTPAAVARRAAEILETPGIWIRGSLVAFPRNDDDEVIEELGENVEGHECWWMIERLHFGDKPCGVCALGAIDLAYWQLAEPQYDPDRDPSLFRFACDVADPINDIANAIAAPIQERIVARTDEIDNPAAASADLYGSTFEPQHYLVAFNDRVAPTVDEITALLRAAADELEAVA